ncbi:MAG: hypothetical protein FJX56_06095 [Alphaproteobacteria bacterium]|nr:hypothetical protein [Alphaproteobacteria bacterium]
MAEPTFATGDIVAVAVALGLLIALVALRGLSGGRVEVKLADAAIAVIRSCSGSSCPARSPSSASAA